MAFASRFLVNLTILTLICMIIFAFISCVEAALTDSRSLHFFSYLLYSYLGVAGVRADNGDSDSNCGDGGDGNRDPGSDGSDGNEWW